LGPGQRGEGESKNPWSALLNEAMLTQPKERGNGVGRGVSLAHEMSAYSGPLGYSYQPGGTGMVAYPKGSGAGDEAARGDFVDAGEKNTWFQAAEIIGITDKQKASKNGGSVVEKFAVDVDCGTVGNRGN
jgi:hypothetical protein